MTTNSEQQKTLNALEARIKAILPEQYQDCYEDVQPVSMGSAGLKFDGSGKVAWDEIWGTFCDLAMAGGPPHKGMLLEPGPRAEIETESERYQAVVEEICRGIFMVTDLAAHPSPIPGWIQVSCESDEMAGWLTRAIVMENISARFDGDVLCLPAGPHYRVEKEIKNVITAIAKTCHYWVEHMWLSQQRAIANLFAKMKLEWPLVQPALRGHDFEADQHQILCGKMAQTIHQKTGLQPSNHQYAGWLGVECPDVPAAIWMMRAMVASNVLSRREGTVLFLPVNPRTDPDGETVVRSIVQIHGFAAAKKII